MPQSPHARHTQNPATPEERESEIALEISEALDAILAYANTLDQDLPMVQKWPPKWAELPPGASEAERRGLDVFDNDRLSKQLEQRHGNRISWKDQL
jgi:hypothetical protein